MRVYDTTHHKLCVAEPFRSRHISWSVLYHQLLPLAWVTAGSSRGSCVVHDGGIMGIGKCGREGYFFVIPAQAGIFTISVLEC